MYDCFHGCFLWSGWCGRRFLQLRRGTAELLHAAEPAYQIIAGTDLGMFCRVLLRLTGRKAGDRRVVIEVEEGRDRVALASTSVDHAVRVRDIEIVGPHFEHVA